MQINFTSLIFSNLLSYGAGENKINFDSKLNLISGSNGMGKTATIEALTFCLFGKPFRKIKIDEIINWRNKGNLKTACEFIVNGTDKYRIVRNLKPDLFQIFKNGKELDLLSHKKLNQEELNKILGVNYEVFKSTIALAISYNEPFLNMDAKNKRALVEQSFGIAVFSKMLELVKKRTSENKKRKEMAEYSVETIQSSIESLENQYLDLVKVNEDFETDKNKRILELEKCISDRKLNIDSMSITSKELTDKIEKNQEKLSKVEKSKVQENEKKLEKKLNSLENTCKTLTDKIKYLENNPNCPTCGSKIDEDKRTSEININKESYSVSMTEVEKYAKTLKITSDTLEKIESIELEKYNTQKKLDLLKINLKNEQREISFYEQELVKVREKKNEIDLKDFRNSINKKKEELVTKNNDCSTWNNMSSILKTASAVLSEEGVRTYVIDKILPLLNKKINEYLDIFELPVKITFNKQMEEKIVNLKNFRTEVSYYSCSEGEKKRIDFAMLLSFIETMKIVSNWNCNLLIIDELLDSSIDEVGLEKMIQTLKKISTEKGIGVYVISHRISNELSNYFTNIIKIKKDENQFSSLETS